MTSERAASARARASRQNGARSNGPTTAAGKLRSSQNALRHGLRARRLLIEGEDAAEFGAFAASVRAELGPVGALQDDLVGRIVMAAWRARRGDRLEAALLERYLGADDPAGQGCGAVPDAGASGRRQAQRLGAGLIRDGNGPRALETLVRYRGSVQAELFRALAALRLLQAEACAPVHGRPRTGTATVVQTMLPSPRPAATERT